MGEEIINEQQIQDWKATWGKVFKTTVGDETVIWRKIKRKEYVDIMQDNFGGEALSDYERVCLRQDTIVAMCSLWPVEITSMVENNAGLATQVADEIVFRSGFETPKTEAL